MFGVWGQTEDSFWGELYSQRAISRLETKERGGSRRPSASKVLLGLELPPPRSGRPFASTVPKKVPALGGSTRPLTRPGVTELLFIKGLRRDQCLLRHTSLLAYIFSTRRHVSSRPGVVETSSHVLPGCLEEKGDPSPHMVFLQANALARPLDRALTASGLWCFMAEAGGPGCGAWGGTGHRPALRCDLTRCGPEVSHDAPSPPPSVGSVPSSGKLGGQQCCWSGPAPASFSRVSRRPPWMGRLTAAVWNIY